jgi:hypothetical protein
VLEVLVGFIQQGFGEFLVKRKKVFKVNSEAFSALDCHLTDFFSVRLFFEKFQKTLLWVR